MTTVNNATVFANAFAGCMSGIINSSRAETSLVESQFDSQNQVANLYALEFDAMWALLGPSSPDVFEYEAIESNSASTWYNRNLPDTTTLGTVTQATFTTLCVNIIESILSADALIAAEGVVIPKPSSGGGNGWTTVLDIDFTSLPNQTLGTDGPVTIDGMFWTKNGSSNESAPTSIVNGIGLIWQPSYGSNYIENVHSGYTPPYPLPYLYLPLESLIPTLSVDTQIRLYLSIGQETLPIVPATSGSNFSMLGVGTEDLATLCLSMRRGTNVNPSTPSSNGIACSLITSLWGYEFVVTNKFQGVFPPNSNYSVPQQEDNNVATVILSTKGFFPSCVSCCQGPEISPGASFPTPNEFSNMQILPNFIGNTLVFTAIEGYGYPQQPILASCGLIIAAGFNEAIDDEGSPYQVTIQRVRIDILG